MIGLLEFFEHQPSVLLLSLNVEDILLNPLYYALILQITDRLFDEQDFVPVSGALMLPLVEDLLERLK